VQGSLNTISSKKHPVAIKILKPNMDLNYLRALLNQIKIVTKVGSHLHIVGCIGGVTDRLGRGLDF
jgi:hypothetical protein